MREIFQQQHGYELILFLPFLGASSTYPADDVPGFHAIDDAVVQKVQNDYRQTLTTLYIRNHLLPLEKMAQRHGLSLRYQVAYNKPMQIEDSALAVSIPETEALGRSSLDMQRYMAGAVHLARKPFYSIETSAELNNENGQSLQDILWWIKRAWSAGVNIQRFHGESYSGQFDGPGNLDGQLAAERWPGYSAFHTFFSNNWTRGTSPESLRQVISYIARTNFIMQKLAKTDVAIYDDQPDVYVDQVHSHGDGKAVYPDSGVLNARGFSYDFVSPALLDLPQAKVTNRRLASAGPAYKALILHHEDSITMHTVERLKVLAVTGLPIIFVGSPPTRNISYAEQIRGHSDADIRAAVAELMGLPTVAVVPDYADVPTTLRRFGICADAEIDGQADVLTQHRIDANGDYYYLYNYNKVSITDDTLIGDSKDRTKYPNFDKSAYLRPKTVTISLNGRGHPYVLNPWTGEISPISQFSASARRVSLTIRLEGGEAVLIALLTDEQAKRNHIQVADVWASTSAVPEKDLVYSLGGLLAAKTVQSGTYTFQLNDGRAATINVSRVEGPKVIHDWVLTIQSITAPAGGSILFQDSVWQTLGAFSLGRELRPWTEIDTTLAHISGVGTYTGSFTLEQGWDVNGSAYLDLGSSDDIVAVVLNGARLPALGPEITIVDLGRYARSGKNTVEVKVASTLFNSATEASRPYGLRGNNGFVTVTPYRVTKIIPNGLATRKRRNVYSSGQR